MMIALAMLAPLQEVPVNTEAVEGPVFSNQCASEEYRAFDFWLGEWDVVVTGKDTIVAESRIQRLSGGCTIRETWMPEAGPQQASLSQRNHRSGRWQQLWIGADGRRVDFEGGPVDGNMVMTGYWDDIGGPGVDALIRIRWTPNASGTVRQAGEASTDHGLTWKPFFDYTYRPKAD